jgi:hypothetical protein
MAVEDTIMDVSWTLDDVQKQLIRLGLDDVSEEDLAEFISTNSEEIMDSAQEAGNEKMEELLLTAFSERVDALTGCEDDDE